MDDETESVSTDEPIISFEEYVDPARAEGVAGMAMLAGYLTKGGISSIIDGEERIVFGMKDSHGNSILVALRQRDAVDIARDLMVWIEEAGTRRLLRDVMGRGGG